MDYSAIQINFLGVTVAKVANKWETDLCCKPTDTQQYLHAQSCHSNVYKGSIAYGQVVSFKRICSTQRTVSFQIRDKKVDDNIALVLRYHPAMNQLYEILLRAHKHVLNPPRLHSGLPSPPRVAFRNPKNNQRQTRSF